MTVSGLFPLGSQAAGFFDNSSGSIAFSQAGVRAGGGSWLVEFNAVASNSKLGMNMSGAALVGSLWLYIVSAPTGAQSIIQGSCSTGNFALGLDAGPNLNPKIGTTQVTGPTLPVGEWLQIDYRFGFDGSGNAVLDYRVNGVGQTSLTVAQATATLTQLNVGWLSSLQNADLRFMDIVYSVTSADYPLGSYIVKPLAPTGCGTHSFTAGDFQKTGAAAITSGETSSWQEIDEMPPANADYVAQVVLRTTSYLEYTFPAFDVAPSVVCPLAGFQGAATGGYAVEVRPYDGTSEGTDVTSGVTKSAATARFGKSMLAAKPSGGAWGTIAPRLRFGYSGDVTPNPQLNSIGLIYASPDSVITSSDAASVV